VARSSKRALRSTGEVPVPILAVASYGRAGRVSTVDVFPEGVIVVPRKQEDAYRALQPLPEGWSIQAIPDEEDGNLCRKRNAILRLFRGQDVVIVDDDYEYVGRWEAGEDRRLDADGIRHLLWQGAVLARDLGTPFWGINVQVDRRFYREYTPLSVTNVVLGPFQAFTADRPDDLLYDESLWLKEDYDLSLRVLHRWHRILRMNAYHYRVDHFNEAGGQVGKRNMEEEVRQLHLLQRRWGSDVVKLELHRSVNPIVKVPLKGV
jgi:glycosyltransferase involved in cell wall biosynthesis